MVINAGIKGLEGSKINFPIFTTLFHFLEDLGVFNGIWAILEFVGVDCSARSTSGGVRGGLGPPAVGVYPCESRSKCL